MKTVVFRVDSLPIAQPRARARAVPTDKRRRNGERIYTAQFYNVTTIKIAGTKKTKPHPILAFKAAVAKSAEAKFRKPLTGPLKVDMCFIFPRESSKVWKSKPMHRYWHKCKPDRDNLDKAVMDALKDIAWNDDSQAALGEIAKFRCGAGDEPCVIVRVSELSDEVKTWADEFLGDRKRETMLF